MTFLKKGNLILGIAEKNYSLILKDNDKRRRIVRVNTYHEHITKLLDPIWINNDWENFLLPSTMEDAHNSTMIQTQISKMESSKQHSFAVETQVPEGILGMYLGKWFLNPERDVDVLYRMIFVLVGERVCWIPIMEG